MSFGRLAGTALEFVFNILLRMYNEFSSIQDLMSFDNEIFDALQEYCDNREAYPDDVVLAIHPDTLEITIDSPEKVNGFETYPIKNLLRGEEPDGDETNDIAHKYIFVR